MELLKLRKPVAKEDAEKNRMKGELPEEPPAGAEQAAEKRSVLR
jgi:hypothetical protein